MSRVDEILEEIDEICDCCDAPSKEYILTKRIEELEKILDAAVKFKS